jgi:hypothetical protein
MPSVRRRQEQKTSWATPRGDKKRYKQCDSLFHAKNLLLLTPRQKELRTLYVFQRRLLRGLLLQIFEISTLFAAKSLRGKKSSGAYERKHCHCRSKFWSNRYIGWEPGVNGFRDRKFECKSFQQLAFERVSPTLRATFMAFILFSLVLRQKRENVTWPAVDLLENIFQSCSSKKKNIFAHYPKSEGN